MAATLYALMAGHPPHFPASGESPGMWALLARHGQQVEDIPGVPARMMDILQACLAADPSQRLPSAACAAGRARGAARRRARPGPVTGVAGAGRAVDGSAMSSSRVSSPGGSGPPQPGESLADPAAGSRTGAPAESLAGSAGGAGTTSRGRARRGCPGGPAASFPDAGRSGRRRGRSRGRRAASRASPALARRRSGRQRPGQHARRARLGQHARRRPRPGRSACSGSRRRLSTARRRR